MKSLLSVLAVLFIGLHLQAQISVNDCSVYTRKVSQTHLNNSDIINGSCIELGGNNNASSIFQDENKVIKASSSIYLKSGVEIGNFSNGGQAHFFIQKEDLDIAVMNYENLYEVKKYKKLELGIPLPQDIENRIMQFVNKTGPDSLKLNPFVDWDIDVKCYFYHPSSGWYSAINGFYTREYEQNEATSDWDDIGTDYPFRIRFAPPENGEWRANVNIKIKGEDKYSSGFFYFNVVESGDPGYVHVHENRRNLKRGSNIIYPIGVNFTSPNSDVDFIGWGGPSGESFVDDVHYLLDSANNVIQYFGHNLYDTEPKTSEKATNIVSWNKYLSALEQYLQAPDSGGSKYFRIMQAPWSSLIEFEERGNYYNRLHYAYETDKILELSEEYDALFQFNLLWHVSMMKYADFDLWLWDWDHYLEGGVLNDDPDKAWQYNRGVYCYNDKPSKLINNIPVAGTKEPYEMFTDLTDLAYHKQRTRYYIARYGYSTKIYAFEILSEPWHLNQEWTTMEGNSNGSAPYEDKLHPDHNNVRNAIENYHETISTYIKDSLNHNHHLVGIDMNGHDVGIDKSVKLPSIDLVGINTYYLEPNGLMKDLDNNNTIYDYVQKIWEFRGGKLPVIVPEGGTEPSFHACSGNTQHVVDKMTFPFSGIAGYNEWAADNEIYQASSSDPVILPNYIHDKWAATIRAKNHMNGIDVVGALAQGGGYWGKIIHEGWKKGTSKSKGDVAAIEVQAYTSNNKENMVGYVRNRTFNLYTTSLGGKCQDVDYNINSKISDLKPVNSLQNITWDDIKNSSNKIGGLKKNKKYTVHFYGDNNGSISYISTDEKRTSLSGELILRYPELWVKESWQNRPTVWFVASLSASAGRTDNHNEREVAETLESSLLYRTFPFDANNKEDPVVAPNPSRDKLTINSPIADEIIIQAITGEIVKTNKVSTGATRIDISSLSSGTYYVHFSKQQTSIKITVL